MDLATEIKISDKHFTRLIPNAKIRVAIESMAIEINRINAGQEIDILVVLDGAEPFAKCILPLLSFPHKAHFIRVKTYEGMHSMSIFNVDDSLFDQLKGREVLLLEDIIDSGFTLFKLIEKLKEWRIEPIQVAALLVKPANMKYAVKPDFTGFEIGGDFVIGFGMDYNEEGRELLDIYSCNNP